jgi:hypothetical protein
LKVIKRNGRTAFVTVCLAPAVHSVRALLSHTSARVLRHVHALPI